MKCVSCGNKEYLELFNSGKFKIKRCRKCGLVRTFGKQSVSYEKYHRDSDYELHGKMFRNIFKKRFNLISSYKGDGRVLEVGTATGTMLDLFKGSGWETWGVEPSGSAEVAEKKGHKILKGLFEKVKLPSGYFDVVILNHILEHVEDPARVLSKVKDVLKIGGTVYVDVPNFGSLSAKIGGKRWKYLLPNEHVHHFEPKTLSGIVEKAGLEMVERRTWSGIFDVASPLGHFWIQLTSGRPHMYRKFVEDLMGIPGNIVATLLNRGTNLVIVGKASKIV